MGFRHAYVNGGSQVRRVLVLVQCISKVLEVWRLFTWLRGCICASLSGRISIRLLDARTLLDMVLESRRVHLMYLFDGTVPFGFLTILYFWCFDLLLGKEVEMLLEREGLQAFSLG